MDGGQGNAVGKVTQVLGAVVDVKFDGELPAIHPAVDIYNCVALESRLTLGAHDMGRVDGAGSPLPASISGHSETARIKF